MISHDGVHPDHVGPAGQMMDSPTGRVLVALNDRNVASVLRAHLANARFTVDLCHDGNAALRFLQAQGPDVALLDAELADLGGLEIVRRVRGAENVQHAPIILLTGNGTRTDAIAGLDAGAQDYVLKPFDVEEMTARVRSMLRICAAKKAMYALNTRLLDEVAEQSASLELLYGFVRELNQARTAERIYELVIETVQRATGCQRISIMRLDPATDRLVCTRAEGIDPEFAEQLSIDPAAGIAGQVFSTGDTVVARAINNDADRSYASDAFVSTPLVSTYLNSCETRLGVLNITDKPDGAPFTKEEIEMLCSIAGSAAIALHNVEHEAAQKRAIRALLLTVGRLSEYRDEETGLHLERVRDYARTLARRLARCPKYAAIVTPSFIEDLHQAAPLHDIGKVAIPDEILNKPGRLTHEEFQIMKTHTTIGRHTLNMAIVETGPNPLLRMCVDIAYCHHERWDGKGYPRGLAGERIPLTARIIGLVDAYDAITSLRCYKQPIPHDEAVAIIRAESGKHFDPDVVEAFLAVADEFDRIRIAKADEAEDLEPTESLPVA